jgi:hypothetical protein
MSVVPSLLRLATLIASTPRASAPATPTAPITPSAPNVSRPTSFTVPSTPPRTGHQPRAERATGVSAATTSAGLNNVSRLVDTGYFTPSKVLTTITGSATATADFAAGILRTRASLQFSASNGYGTAVARPTPAWATSSP